MQMVLATWADQFKNEPSMSGVAGLYRQTRSETARFTTCLLSLACDEYSCGWDGDSKIAGACSNLLALGSRAQSRVF